MPSPAHRLAPTLLGVALASFLLPLAVTAPAVGLPAVGRDLGASPTACQWLVNAYAITLATTVLAAGGLADRFGRVRVLRLGTVVFALASLAVAAAPGILLADLARVVQALGGAGILASGAAVIAHAAPPARRAQAFGVLGAAFGAGLALGPLVGGLLTPLGWRVPFVVVAALAFLAGAVARLAPESRNPAAARIDLAGMASFCLTLLALSCFFVVAPDAGWLSPPVLGLLLATLAAGVAFVRVELRVAAPMFDVRLFRRRRFVAVVCQPFTITLAFVVLLVFLPSFVQAAGGRSVPAAGAMLLPLTVPVLVLPLLAGPITGRLGVRGTLVTASVTIAAGTALLVLTDADAGFGSMAPGLLVAGLGVGLAFTVMDNAAVGAVPVDRAGVASGMFNTMRLSGESIGIAAAGAVLTSLTTARLGPGSHDAAAAAVGGRPVDGAAGAALAGALHTTMLGLAVLALLGAGATWLALGPDRQRSRRRNATMPAPTTTRR